MLVSIITPSYNQANFLEATIHPLKDVELGPWTPAQQDEVRRMLAQLYGLVGQAPGPADR